MTYSIIGILASIILIINNRDVLWTGRSIAPAQRSYRLFLMGVMLYYITDLLWGILEALGRYGCALCGDGGGRHAVDTVCHLLP